SAVGNRWEAARADSEEMELEIARGALDRAQALAESAAATYAALGDVLRPARIVKHLARIASLRGGVTPAEAAFAPALALTAEDPNRVVRAEIYDSRAETRADAGRVDDALADLALAEKLATESGSEALAQAVALHSHAVRERQFAERVLSSYMDPK